MTRRLTVCAGGLVWAWASIATAAVAPPTITATNQVAECRNPTVSVWINPRLSSATDPLPIATFRDRISTDPNAYPSNTDPDNYPLGLRTVTITACDHASPANCSNQNVTVNVRDTKGPTIQVNTNTSAQCISPSGTPSSPTYCADTCDSSCNPTTACTNPNTQSSTSCQNCKLNCVNTCAANPNAVHLDRPTVTDLCDPAPVWASSAQPATYPIGTTSLTVTAGDFTGNVSTKTINVQVVDTQPPVFTTSVPGWNVVSHKTGGAGDPLSCVLSGGAGSGTLVTMVHPNASDTCTVPSKLAYTWGYGGSEYQTANLCLADGTNQVQFIVRDGVGNSDTSKGASPTNANIVVATSFPLSMTLTGSAGYVTSGSLSASLSSGTTPITWRLVGAFGPDASVGTTTSITGTFSTEGNYCPYYVSATDSSGTPKSAAANPLCFAVDRTKPSFTYTGVPAQSSYPGGVAPIFSHGTPLPIAINAQDTNGPVFSGVKRVQVAVESSGAPSTVYDNTYCTNAASGATALPNCSTQHYVSGCNQTSNALCTCTNVDGTGECTTSGALKLNSLANGNYNVLITVTDLAGNSNSSRFPFSVGDLPTTLVGTSATTPTGGLAVMLQNSIASTSTPSTAKSFLTLALNYVKSAATIFPESPGQAFLLLRQAWTQVDTAGSFGASVDFYRTYLAQVVNGEASEIIGAYQAKFNAGNMTTWAILADPNTNDVYQTRLFLEQVGGVTREYAVNPNTTLTLATDLEKVANQYFTLSQTSQAIDTSVLALNALSTLHQDDVIAGLYGRSVHTMNVGTTANPNIVTEQYFRGGPASHFGNEASIVVKQQIARFSALAQGGALFGVPAATLTTLQQVSSSIGTFSNNVSIVQNNNWNVAVSGFNNNTVVAGIYLPAINALQTLQTLQGASIYTNMWQAGIGFTLADVVNFSVYEGPTALACLLWGQDSPLPYGGCSSRTRAPHPAIYNMTGVPLSPSLMDYEAQVAECRYSRMMYALGDGRLIGGGVGALDLFVNSKCLIIDLYNRYYAISNPYLPGDVAINPNTYGCPTTAATFTSAQTATECGGCAVGGASVTDSTCDGIDSDCNGQVDDGVVNTTCGCPGLAANYICPCLSSSACINGQTLPCVPGLPPTTVDTLCNGKDNACTGHPASNYVPVSCGIGGCTSYSSCNAGTETVCTPKSPVAETCNGADDNCNVAIDEGLDNDRDNYGCPPCTSLVGNANCTAVKGCTWVSSACTGKVACNQCTPGAGSCGNGLLCSGDKNTSGAWTGVWDCDDTDPTVYPGGVEVCDGKDNNCNGVIDEGVKNACGNCDPSCTSTVIGSGGSPFDATSLNSQNIAQDPNTGNLGLTSQSLNLQYAWISNDTAGTISKIDMTTGKEVGRYCQAIKTGVTTFVRSGGKDPTGAAYDTRSEPTVCAGCGGCNNGSRTAIDLSGNMFIANRAYSDSGYVGTYTKVAGNVTGCIDVDGDGKIETSSDVNGDGVINPNQSLNPNIREYWGELDECILWTRKPVQWDQAVQPSCNDPNWPYNNPVKDPLNVSLNDEAAACVVDPNSPAGLCQWTTACQGNGDTSCSSLSTQLLCGLKSSCSWTSQCTGVTGCNTLTTQSQCNVYKSYGCSWTSSCQPVACSVQNANQNLCNAMTGCSYYHKCYNIGDGPFPNVTMAMPRAMALDANGFPWVGLFNRRGFMQVNPLNGYVKRWAYTGYQPYGSSLDRNGILWHGDWCCQSSYLAGLNTTGNTVKYINPDNGNTTFTWAPYGTQASAVKTANGSYGVATDNKGYVYVGSYPLTTLAGFRFDAYRNTWTNIPSSTDSKGNVLADAGVGRGTAVDPGGNIWIAQMGSSGGGRLTGFNPNTLKPIVDVDFGTKGITPIGVGVGYAGRIWTSNQGSNNVAVVDPTTSSVGYYPVGGPPYCYSDFTGAVLRTFTSPTGSYAEIVNACYGFSVNNWVNLTWNGITPVGTANQGKATSVTAIQMRMRGTNQLVTSINGTPVDPSANSTWTLWYPDDVSDPNKNPSDPNRVYYWQLQPSSSWPTSGACAGLNASTFSSALNSYTIAGCADISALPTTMPSNGLPIGYVQVQAILVSDGDNTVQPSLVNFQISRTCPQL